MNVLSLFSGIGGFDLGLQRAGMTVVGQVELDPWCRQVLAKHWPEVPRHDDVRTALGWWMGSTRPRVDVVAAGFPCQPVSAAGKQLAQADPRWLWPATWAVVRHLRPRVVLLENVLGLIARGLADVLGDLAHGGYDAEWDCVSAASVGAPHIRRRVFIIATPSGVPDPGRVVQRDVGERGGEQYAVPRPALFAHHGAAFAVADADRLDRGPASRDADQGDSAETVRETAAEPRRRGHTVADPDGSREPITGRESDVGWGRAADSGAARRGRRAVRWNPVEGYGVETVAGPPGGTAAPAGASDDVAHAEGRRLDSGTVATTASAGRRPEPTAGGHDVAHTSGDGRGTVGAGRPVDDGPPRGEFASPRLGDPDRTRLPVTEPQRQFWRSTTQSDWWSTEPDVGRVANGVPRRVDRLRGLGNAIVPQVAEHVGRLIVDREDRQK